MEEHEPYVSVIIPTLDGKRGGRVALFLESLEAQSFEDFETVLVEGISPQGKAINEGVRRARGRVIVIADDDTCLADGKVLHQLIKTLESDKGIGMAGASIVLPEDATRFERRAAIEFPRFNMPVVEEVTTSDMACHGCCALRKEVFEEVGGEREDIIRGLDPDLRARLRRAGYRVVLAPHARIHHPLPQNMKGLLRLFFRNGYGSAYARKFRPESIYETHEHVDSEGFTEKTSLTYRVLRFPVRLLWAVCRGRFLRFFAYCAYACGYAWGAVTAREDALGQGV